MHKQLIIGIIAALALIASQAADVANEYSWLLNERHQSMLALFISRGDFAIRTIAIGLWHLLVLLSTHIALVLLWLASYRAICARHCPTALDSARVFSSTLAIYIISLMLLNRALFPSSVVFPNGDLISRNPVSTAVAAVQMTALAYGLCLAILRTISRLKLRAVTAALLGLCGLAAIADDAPDRSAEQPNIIIIGIDSLRPDHLFRNDLGVALTENLSNAIAGSVFFDQAYVAAARTFVSYSTILTGNYPTQSGIRFNLQAWDTFNPSSNIVRTLKEGAGYSTLYATDEARFANFDSRWGFDRTITPGIGVMDFAIGSALDSIGTNLATLIPGVARALPYTFGNRAAHPAYRPESFISKVSEELAKSDGPLFAVIHLCFPHWPYVRHAPLGYDDYVPLPRGDEMSSNEKAYLNALHIVDEQFGDIQNTLRDSGLLDHAIVVILSDHGESLALDHDIIELDDGRQIHNGVGHGTFALSDAQNRVALAFQYYRDGVPQWEAGTRNDRVSLIDVSPTLAELTGQSSFGSRAGTSLVPSIVRAEAPPSRLLFVETGITGPTTSTKELNSEAIAGEFSGLYEITDDLRFEIRASEMDYRINLKQRAVMGPTTRLAAVPEIAGDPGCWLRLAYDSRVAACVDDPWGHQEFAPLAESICNHWRHDEQFVETWCAPVKNIQ